MDYDMACSRCNCSKLQKPALKLFINNCGHSLCDNCIDVLYPANKGSNNCSSCSMPLRRVDFRLQLFQDCLVEKEVDIRRKILKDYNMKEDDFDTLAEYNDYLEDIEDIIYNLANSVDVDTTKRKVEKYKKDNTEAIQKNRRKLNKDEIEIEMLIEQEKEKEEWRRQMYLRQDQDFVKTKTIQKEALVDELMFSDLPANQILATHERNKKRLENDKKNEQPLPKPVHKQHSYFSTGIKAGAGSSLFLPVPKAEDDAQYVYTDPVYDTMGPKCPTFGELEVSGYLRHVRSIDAGERAGGFFPEYACLRALQESLNGLYFQPE